MKFFDYLYIPREAYDLLLYMNTFLNPTLYIRQINYYPDFEIETNEEKRIKFFFGELNNITDISIIYLLFYSSIGYLIRNKYLNRISDKGVEVGFILTKKGKIKGKSRNYFWLKIFPKEDLLKSLTNENKEVRLFASRILNKKNRIYEIYIYK